MEKQKNIAGDVNKELQEAEKLNVVEDVVAAASTWGVGPICTIACC